MFAIQEYIDTLDSADPHLRKRVQALNVAVQMALFTESELLELRPRSLHRLREDVKESIADGFLEFLKRPDIQQRLKQAATYREMRQLLRTPKDISIGQRIADRQLFPPSHIFSPHFHLKVQLDNLSALFAPMLSSLQFPELQNCFTKDINSKVSATVLAKDVVQLLWHEVERRGLEVSGVRLVCPTGEVFELGGGGPTIYCVGGPITDAERIMAIVHAVCGGWHKGLLGVCSILQMPTESQCGLAAKFQLLKVHCDQAKLEWSAESDVGYLATTPPVDRGFVQRLLHLCSSKAPSHPIQVEATEWFNVALPSRNYEASAGICRSVKNAGKVDWTFEPTSSEARNYDLILDKLNQEFRRGVPSKHEEREWQEVLERALTGSYTCDLLKLYEIAESEPDALHQKWGGSKVIAHFLRNYLRYHPVIYRYLSEVRLARLIRAPPQDAQSAQDLCEPHVFFTMPRLPFFPHYRWGAPPGLDGQLSQAVMRYIQESEVSEHAPGPLSANVLSNLIKCLYPIMFWSVSKSAAPIEIARDSEPIMMVGNTRLETAGTVVACAPKDLFSRVGQCHIIQLIKKQRAQKSNSPWVMLAGCNKSGSGTLHLLTRMVYISNPKKFDYAPEVQAGEMIIECDTYSGTLTGIRGGELVLKRLALVAEGPKPIYYNETSVKPRESTPTTDASSTPADSSDLMTSPSQQSPLISVQSRGYRPEGHRRHGSPMQDGYPGGYRAQGGYFMQEGYPAQAPPYRQDVHIHTGAQPARQRGYSGASMAMGVAGGVVGGLILGELLDDAFGNRETYREPPPRPAREPVRPLDWQAGEPVRPLDWPAGEPVRPLEWPAGEPVRPLDWPAGEPVRPLDMPGDGRRPQRGGFVETFSETIEISNEPEARPARDRRYRDTGYEQMTFEVDYEETRQTAPAYDDGAYRRFDRPAYDNGRYRDNRRYGNQGDIDASFDVSIGTNGFRADEEVFDADFNF